MEFTSEKVVNLLWQRAVVIGMNDARLMMFPPTEFWDRYVALQKKLKDARDLDRNLRTKITIGWDDFTLWTKRAREKQWNEQDINEYRELPPHYMQPCFPFPIKPSIYPAFILSPTYSHTLHTGSGDTRINWHKLAKIG